MPRVSAAENTRHADSWVRISTADKGRPVQVPLHTHKALAARLSRQGQC